MKNYFVCVGLAMSLICLSASGMACNRKTGCPANDSLSAKTNRKGEYSSKGGTTNLFSKKTRKKMKN